MASLPQRICKQCGESSANVSFPTRMLLCPSCYREYQRDWKRAKGQTGTPDSRRAKRRERAYGISREETINMLLEQDFTCPICLKPMDFEKLCIDHNHETGKVRGVLDNSCNTALGKFDDNVATLTRAQMYLEVRG